MNRWGCAFQNPGFEPKALGQIDHAYSDPGGDPPINVYLSPDPLDEDSFLEEDSLDWIPGFKKGEDPVSGEPALYRPENIELYEQLIEKVRLNALAGYRTLEHLFSGHHIQSINICIDLQPIDWKPNTLACYNGSESKPHAGIYHFTAYPTLTSQYLSSPNGNYDSVEIWIHEFIHLLDHQNIMAGCLYGSSDSPAENLKHHMLKFREEGLANMHQLLTGGGKFDSREEAISEFLTKQEKAEQMTSTWQTSDHQKRKELFGGFAFYSAGPWVLLECLRHYPDPAFQELIEDCLLKAERRESVLPEMIWEVLRGGLEMGPYEFLDRASQLQFKLTENQLKSL